MATINARLLAALADLGPTKAILAGNAAMFAGAMVLHAGSRAETNAAGPRVEERPRQCVASERGSRVLLRD